jgi:AcrR family transcriptional regulator
MKIASVRGTKARLLQAGRQVFAQHGLQNATVRDICDLAEANVAAVSYHFGSKEKLYVSVLGDYLMDGERRYPLDLGITPQSSPEERLRAVVRGFLRQALGDGDAVSERLGKLVMQEIIEPSELFGELFEKHCRPRRDRLFEIVKQMLPGFDELVAARCASSIAGQCMLFDFARETMARMTPELVLKASNLDSIVDFIFEFSMGGIERLRSQNTATATA